MRCPICRSLVVVAREVYAMDFLGVVCNAFVEHFGAIFPGAFPKCVAELQIFMGFLVPPVVRCD